jgi:oxygen-dependent protoporphyrinogen oxidase
MIAKQRATRRRRQAGGSASTVDAGPGGNLTSFRDGMETLPQALAATIPELSLATPISAIERRTGEGGGYRLRTSGGDTIDTSRIVIATAPWVAAQLLGALDSTLADELAAISASPIAVVATGFATDTLPRPLDGFGFLVPRGQGLRMLGCLWDSSIFRFRAPVGKVLMRTMIGGAHDPEAALLEPNELLAITRRELAQVLGITAEPDLVRVIQHRRGIPQYPLGHGDRLRRIHARLDRLPGIHITGWGYRGIAVNRVIEDAVAVARQVAEAAAKPVAEPTGR